MVFPFSLTGIRNGSIVLVLYPLVKGLSVAFAVRPGKLKFPKFCDYRNRACKNPGLGVTFKWDSRHQCDTPVWEHIHTDAQSFCNYLNEWFRAVGQHKDLDDGAPARGYLHPPRFRRRSVARPATAKSDSVAGSGITSNRSNPRAPPPGDSFSGTP